MDDWNGKVTRPPAPFLIDPFILVCGDGQRIEPTGEAAESRGAWMEVHSLLTRIGGVFPQAFIRPPRKMGTYVTLQLAKTGEFFGGLQHGWIHRGLSSASCHSYLQDVEGNVTEGAHNIQVELDLGRRHGFSLPVQTVLADVWLTVFRISSVELLDWELNAPYLLT